MPERLHRTWLHSDRFIPAHFVRPVTHFMAREASSGLVMLAAAVLALLWANLAPDSYTGFWDTHLLLQVGEFQFEESLLHLVNDGLMVIFFFVVGLEIKRELLLGELRDRKAAALPLLAAVGGMAFPALIFMLIAGDVEGAARGWGVPVATDIAFSLGVLSLLGPRVPTGAKLFLLALAVADDLGGILVIAIFYTDQLAVEWLGGALGSMLVIATASRVGVRSHVVYLPMALGVWYCFLQSGVHATLAGVAIAMLTPAWPMYGMEELDRKARRLLDTFARGTDQQRSREEADYEALMLADIAREGVAPLSRAEHRLTPWSSFLVVPVFALANAGVSFAGTGFWQAITSRVALGVLVGLVVGKTVGITLFSWLAVRLGLGRLPAGTGWGHMVGVAATAGIGFTVALFIAALAFTDPVLAAQAKVGIFAGSILAGLIGSLILSTRRRKPSGEAPAREPVAVRS